MKRLIIASAATLAACTQAGGPGRPVGMANPASVYCQQTGGVLHIENRPGGQVGICVFPDGARIEEWELYRRDHR